MEDLKIIEISHSKNKIKVYSDGIIRNELEKIILDLSTIVSIIKENNTVKIMNSYFFTFVIFDKDWNERQLDKVFKRILKAIGSEVSELFIED